MDRQDNHRIDNCSVTEHYLYNGNWKYFSKLLILKIQWLILRLCTVWYKQALGNIFIYTQIVGSD